jgi:DNA polymerase bacteriophage-type
VVEEAITSMPILHLDFETRSHADLEDVGAHRYAADPTTSMLCAAYAVDADLVQIWIPGNPVPHPIIAAAADPSWSVVAHNAQFERCISQHILEPRHSWPAIPIERWRCSMAMAYAAALPGGLDKVTEALGLPHVKDKAGKALMLKMCRPLPDGTWLEDPASLERLYEYCRQDVEAERALHRVLPPLTVEEQELWQLDQIINQRGLYTDGELIETAHRVVTNAEAALQAEFRALTGLEGASQVAKLIAWLAEHGCAVTNLTKATLAHALRRRGLAPEVVRAIELRRQLARSSAGKVKALRTWCGNDGRVRGTLQYHGAGTGRWSGRGPQPQNFRKDADGIEAKCAAVLAGGADLTSPVETVGEIARAMICAAPGHRFLIGDFSGVESRVLAWISRQQSKMDIWAKFDRTGDRSDDPYVAIGKALGHPEATARDAGKVADLAFGYAGGLGAWKNMAPEDDASSEQTIKRYRDGWRAQHPATVRFWYRIDQAAIDAIKKPGTDIRVDRLVFRCDQPFLNVRLPSGRSLSYPFPRIATNRFCKPCVVFKDNAGGKFDDCKFGQGAYGGLFAENFVQAISRDLLAAAIVRLEAAGYPIVLHVHDEVVAEIPENFGNLDEFKALLCALPPWAEGLPMAAKVRSGSRFSKADKVNLPPTGEASTGPERPAPPPMPEASDEVPASSTNHQAPPWEEPGEDQELDQEGELDQDGEPILPQIHVTSLDLVELDPVGPEGPRARGPIRRRRARNLQRRRRARNPRIQCRRSKNSLKWPLAARCGILVSKLIHIPQPKLSGRKPATPSSSAGYTATAKMTSLISTNTGGADARSVMRNTPMTFVKHQCRPPKREPQRWPLMRFQRHLRPRYPRPFARRLAATLGAAMVSMRMLTRARPKMSKSNHRAIVNTTAIAPTSRHGVGLLPSTSTAPSVASRT